MISTYGSYPHTGWRNEKVLETESDEDMVPDAELISRWSHDDIDNPKFMRNLSDLSEREIKLFETMKYEVNRLNSFKDKWPLNFVKPKDLAETGFFYLQSEDRVQCAFCYVIIFDWTLGDRPLKEHIIRSPKCPYLMSSNVGNVPLIPHRHPTHEHMETTSANYKPKNPKMSDVKRRLSTYKCWPLTMLTPQQLSECGLYYTGVSDVVTCFFCGGSLGNWDLEDDPFVEHSKYFPDCGYLSLVKNNFGKPNTESTSLKSYTQQSTFTLSLDKEERNRKDFINSEVIRQALEIFPASLVNIVVSERLRRTGECYTSVDEICEEILEHEHNRQAKEQNKTQAMPSNSFISQPQASNSTNFDLDIDTNGRDAAVNSRSVKDTLLCKICMDRDVGAVFQPCGHLVACYKCGQLIHNCPLCRRPITNVVRTYLS